jgi:hypothetical protein
MFKENKYSRIYANLMIRASRRVFLGETPTPDTYYERHHVIPRCMGGSDELDNYAILTAREHYIAHWLLTKMVDGSIKHKLQFAFFRMATVSPSNARKITATQYAIARKHHAEACKTIGGHKVGKPWNATPEEKEKRRQKWKTNNPNNDPVLRAKGDANRAKTYIITHVDGTEESVTNMAAYCRDNNLSAGNMTWVAKGRLPHYKGMRVRFA